MPYRHRKTQAVFDLWLREDSFGWWSFEFITERQTPSFAIVSARKFTQMRLALDSAMASCDNAGLVPMGRGDYIIMRRYGKPEEVKT